MIVQFTPTPEDFRKSTLAFSSKKFWLWFLSGWLGIPIMFMVIISWVTLSIPIDRFGVSVFALTLGFVFTMYPYSAPANAMRQAIRDKKQSLPVKYIFGKDEIFIKSDEYELKYKWISLKGVAESNLFYHLVHSDGQFQFIPKRAFENNAMEQEFRDLILAHFPKMEMLEKGIVGWKLALVSSIISLLVNYSVFTTIGD
jgi:hypothetical protein